jgi:hypothetical protein
MARTTTTTTTTTKAVAAVTVTAAAGCDTQVSISRYIGRFILISDAQ